MNWRNTDCVGMVRIIVQQKSQSLCLSLPTTVDGMRKLCGIKDENMNQLDGLNTPKIGDAVFAYNKEHVNASGKRMPWYHMGIYVGEYTDPVTGIHYSDAIIENTHSVGHVTVTSLKASSKFTHYASLPFVNSP